MAPFPASGTISGDTTLTIALGNRRLYNMHVDALKAPDEATLKIYKDSKVAGNLLFDGKYRDRDQDGNITFWNGVGKDDTTKFIVVIVGGAAADKVDILAEIH